MAGCSSSCHCQHACLLFFSGAASGKFIDLQNYLPSLREFLILSSGQISKMGSGAIALSLPFSCILGLLASMTATTMGMLCLDNALCAWILSSQCNTNSSEICV